MSTTATAKAMACLPGTTLLALTVLLAACAGSDGAPPRNLIIITFDTCRADHVGAYGYERATTPNVDAFAARSIVFEHAYSTAASTAPALSSLMTSKYPHQHGVLETYYFALSPDENTLAERMSAAGRTTAAVLGIGVLMPSRRLDQGFEHYSFTRYTNKQYWKTAPEITAEAVEWLESHSDEPFFLWVHYFEPHQPYDIVPGAYRTRFDGVPNNDPLLARVAENSRYREKVAERLNDYDGALSFVDSEFGRLVGALESHGLFDNSMIIFSADHGETLGEHGQHGHVYGLWEPVVHIPLMIYRPRIRSGRVAENVSLVDVVPTVIEQFRLPADAGLQGRALPLPVRGTFASGLFAAEPTLDQVDAFAETWYSENRGAMINTGSWKFILKQSQDGSSTGALYDISSDPQELRDLASDKPELRARLESDLRAWMVDAFATPGLIRDKPGELEMLRALGYLQ